MVDGLLDERVAGAEVVDDQPVGHAGLLGDGPVRQLAQTAARHHAYGRVQQGGPARPVVRHALAGAALVGGSGGVAHGVDPTGDRLVSAVAA